VPNHTYFKQVVVGNEVVVVVGDSANFEPPTFLNENNVLREFFAFDAFISSSFKR